MLKKILLVAVALIVMLIAVAFWFDAPRFVLGLLTYGQQAREGSLKVGDPAPVVLLVELDGVTTRPLAEWSEARPVVLVFGSFT